MPIWKKPYTLEHLNTCRENTLAGTIGIEITEVGDDFLKGTMPVDHRTNQPLGILHGGASVVLAETLGSVAATIACEEGKVCVGLEINANHLAQVTEGKVTGIAKPVHIGRNTHVWEIRISREDGKLNCISRITMAVIEKR